MSFENFQFPKINNIVPTTISDKIKSVQPMTQKEAAGNRKIKPYPKKFDTFETIEDMENYIDDVFYHNTKLNPKWLKIETNYCLPFNLRDDVYYQSYQETTLTCHEPPDHPLQDIIYGETILVLNPKDPMIGEISSIIRKIQTKYKK